MALSDLLQRLRPTGAPGPAGPVAVPAEDEDAAAAELAPVFEALAPVLDECEEIRSTAGREAEDEIARSHRDADRLVAEASERSSAERAAAATKVRRSGDAAADALLADAEAAAERLRREGGRRLAELTEQVVANVRAAADQAPGTDR